jgi:beta-N-acetylhexosaminidase
MCSWSKGCWVSSQADRRAVRRRELVRRRQTVRRRIGLGAVAVTAAGLGAWIGAGSESGDDSSSGRAGASPTPPSCPDEVASDPRRLAGQMLVVRFEGTATPELMRAARRGEIGGVIAFPPAGADPEDVRAAIARLQDAARSAGAPPLLVATDQEGGGVKRFPTLPPLTSPVELAAAGEAAATAEGRDTGRALRQIGVNADLAPVLDVPAVSGAFMAGRSFGSEPATVAAAGVGFANGLSDAGVAATAKHFPGLGRATANTDLGPSVVGGSRAELAPDLEPFRAAVDAGVSLVMTSNATYAALDEERPASLSPGVTRLLRDRLGFEGVVITDDLFAGAISEAGYGPGDAAVAAAQAGADLLLFARLPAPEALPALTAAIRRGSLDRQALLDACVRNLALRESLAD